MASPHCDTERGSYLHDYIKLLDPDSSKDRWGEDGDGESELPRERDLY